MSYAIHYGPEEQRQKKSHYGWATAVIALVICAAAAGYFVPQQVKELKNILLPWTQESVQEAFADFREEVSSGTPFGEAMEAFCLDILDDAKKQ